MGTEIYQSTHFCHEDGDNMYLENVGNIAHNYTV
jgi:hypothetical protein